MSSSDVSFSGVSKLFCGVESPRRILHKAIIVQTANDGTATAAHLTRKKLSYSLGRWCYGQYVHPSLGLYYDDTADEHSPQVIEAIDRLSKRQTDERVWRLVRGDQLMMKHDHLSHDLWFRPDDPKHFYLQPYLAEIKKEEEERKRWDRM